MTAGTREIAVETDTRLASLYAQAQAIQSRISSAIDTLHRAVGDKRRDRFSGPWMMTYAQVEETATSRTAEAPVARALDSLTALRAELDQVLAETAALDAIYRQHGWNRYFLVTNANGHVHRGMNCTTCYASTEYAWLVELADCDEAAMIDEFGEKACTVCFPAAPANPKFHGPGRRDREALDAKAAEKAAREAKKAAKNLTSDETFRNHRGDRVETVAACKEALRDEVELRDYYGRGAHTWHPESVAAAQRAAEVLVAREARQPGTGATQAEVDRIVANAVKKNRREGARI